MSRPLVAMTAGDCNGIGPEVLLRSISRPPVRSLCVPVLVGPATVFEYYARALHIRLPLQEWKGQHTPPARGVWIVESSHVPVGSIRPGTLSHVAGEAAGLAIVAAAQLALGGFVDAIVTAPVSKQALHLAGFRAPGQTEMLQHLSGSGEVAMMLVAPHLRVGLVTIHEPLARVPSLITSRLVVRQVRIIHDALVQDWGIDRPRIAVLGLNPHAGEGGDIGNEEQRHILPALEVLRQKHMLLEGPFPADGFFARYVPGVYDAVVAMYHDQGLIPLKMSSGNHAVNVTAGLRLVRTSPDHGTAFTLAGCGTADPSSMHEAIRMAVTIAVNRRRHLRRSAHR
jgi:4-hydroxythreonine-4-phosphate dehydrogenase